MKYKTYHHKKMKSKALQYIVITTVLLFFAFAGIFGIYNYSKQTKTFENKAPEIIENTTVSPPKQMPRVSFIPVSKDLGVPYAPQAPFGNWTVHEESCEEAAIYMYKGYLDATTYPNNRIPDTEADSVFRAMKTWQVEKYGIEPDLTMTALGTFAQSYYEFKPTVEKNITADNIKQAIANGHPVIVPVMTHSLQNTMYGPVSVYHVLLIKGYDAAGVITNDAGVGNGVNKHYSWEILWQAIDAQTAKMGQGREMLYLTK